MEFVSSRWQCGQVLVLLLLLYGQRTGALSNPSAVVGIDVAEKGMTHEMNSSLPNYDLYHRSDVFLKELRALVDRHPLIMTMEVLQAEGLKEAGSEGYNTEMTVVTVEAGGKGPKDDQNMRLLLVIRLPLKPSSRIGVLRFTKKMGFVLERCNLLLSAIPPYSQSVEYNPTRRLTHCIVWCFPALFCVVLYFQDFHLLYWHGPDRLSLGFCAFSCLYLSRGTTSLQDFGQHGRELVTSEVALRLLQILGGEYPLGNIDGGALYRILPHATIKIVPMENLNGRRRVEAGDLCERKNGRGVDPNRNWGVDWGKKEKDYDPSEEYPGIAPFSEPEPKILRNLAESFKPHVWVNVHSGMEALFMPYDHKTVIPVDGGPAMKNLLQILNKQHCQDKCVIGSGGGAVGYLAHGTATDYMYDKLRVPMAFTWEIYGDMTQPDSECFQMFNPATASKFETVVSTWSSSFLTLIVNLPKSLHSLPSRYPALEVWDWESWPISTLPEIPDLELRERFSAYIDPLLLVADSDPIEVGTVSRLGAGLATKAEDEAGLLHEYLLLLGGVLVLLVFFNLCRCYWLRWNPLWYGRLLDRGRRIPV